MADVTLSVDAKTGVPLKVVVDARGQTSDAFTVGFRSIDFSTPDASMFEFTPPRRARDDADAADSRSARRAEPPEADRDRDGWARKRSSSCPPVPPARTPLRGLDADPSQLLDELTTSVAGGRALQTSLLSVLLPDDGRILVGAVPIASLEAAAQ